MSAAADIAVEELTDEELKDAPPCECLFWRLWEYRKSRRGVGEHVCGRPSKARLRVNCSACGARYHLFLCRRHAWFFRNGLVYCRVCDKGGPGKIRGTDS